MSETVHGEAIEGEVSEEEASEPTGLDSVDEQELPEPEMYEPLPGEILHPHQYQSGTDHSIAGEASRFEDEHPFDRPTSGEPHAAVPSFFAGPPNGTHVAEVQEEDHDLAKEEPSYEFVEPKPEAEEVTPVVAAPFVGAPLVNPPQPVTAEEGAFFYGDAVA